MKQIDKLLQLAQAEQPKRVTFVNTSGGVECFDLAYFVVKYLAYMGSGIPVCEDAEQQIFDEGVSPLSGEELATLTHTEAFISSESIPLLIEQLEAFTDGSGTLVDLVLDDLKGRDAWDAVD